MKRKLNARTVTLLSLIGALICALLALFAFTNLFNSESKNTDTASAASAVSAPKWTSGGEISANGSTIAVEYSATQSYTLSFSAPGTYYCSRTVYNPGTSATLNGDTLVLPAGFKDTSCFIRFSLNSGVSWDTSPSGGARDLQVKIKQQISIPSLSSTSQNYSASSTTSFTVNQVNTTAKSSTTVTAPTGWDVYGNGYNYTTITVPTGAAIGKYTITVALNDKTYNTWTDGTTDDKTFTYYVNKCTYGTPKWSPTSLTYSTSSQTITVSPTVGGPYSTEFLDAATFTLPTGWTRSGTTITIPARAMGTYRVTMMHGDSNYYGWMNGGGGYGENITINPLGKFSTSQLSKSSADYSPNAQTFTVTTSTNITWTLPTGWTRSGATVTIPAGAAVNTYTLTATPSAGYAWTDETTAAKTFNFNIVKATPTANPAIGPGPYIAGNPLSTVAISGTGSVSGTFYWTDPTEVMTFGTASYGWKFVPVNDISYETVTGTIDITAVGMDEITAEGQKTTYKAFEKFTTEGMTVYAISSGVRRAVTGYTYTVDYGGGRDHFLVEDSGCEVTITYTEGTITKSFSFTVTVGKADVDMRGVTFADTSETYDGNLHTLTYSGTLPTGVSFSKYTYDGVENNTGVLYAGSYEVKAYFNVTDTVNYNAPTLTATLTIDKASQEVNVSVANRYYYVGDALSTVQIAADLAGTVSWTNPNGVIMGTTGNYGWTFVPADTDNYNTVTGVVLVTAYYKLTGITVTGANTTYRAHESFDPTGMVVTASYATGKVDTVIEDKDAYTVSYPREGATYFIIADDGRSMTVTYTENGITVTAPIEITIIANEYDMSGVSMDDLTIDYDGDYHELTIVGDLPEGLTFAGFTYNGDESADGVKNAGTYEVAVVFGNDDPDNYKTPVLKATLTINKATPTVQGVELGSVKHYKGAALSTVYLTYDEDNTSPAGTLAWADGTIKLGSAADGMYKWVYTPNDTTNYNTVEGWIEVSNLQAKVEKIEVLNPTTEYDAYESFVTDGVKVRLTYLDETTEEVDITDCTLDYPGSGRSHFLVGDTEITVWYGDTVSTTVDVTVNKKSVDMSGVTFADKLNEVYDGDLKSIIAENLPDGVTVTGYTYNGSEVDGDGVTDVGTYEVKVYFSVTDTANVAVPEAKTATLKIAQAEPEITVEVDYGRYPEGTTLGNVALKYECDVDGALSWTVGSIVIEDDGEYEWTFRPTDTKNYKTVKGTLTVEIFYEVNSIQVTVNKSEFEAYDTLGKDDITVRADFVNKAPANVDGWTVKYPNGNDYFLVSDTGKDVIISYNDAEYIIHVTVNKKNVDMSGVTFDDKLNEVYDGSTKSITVGNLPDGVAVDHYEYNGEDKNGVKDAGDYTVTVYFKVTDVNITIDTLSKTATLKIAKADSELKFTGKTEFTYSGETLTIESGASVDNSEQTNFTYTNNTFLNVSDSGVMTITVAASTNYNGTSIEVPITVKPAELTLTWTGGTATYDGYSHSASLEVSGAVESDKDVITTDNLAALISVSYTGPDTDRKQKGDYTVTLTSFPEDGVYANYSYTVTNDLYTFTISDSDLKLTFKGDEVTYDGDPHSLSVEGMPAPEEMTVKYYYKDTDNEFEGATDVGTYEIEARFTCKTNNFTAPDPMTATLVINAKSISGCDVDGVDEKHVYDGKAYKPEDVTVTLDGKELEKGVDYTVTYTGSGASAGSTGKVTISGQGNYTGSVDIEYVIVPRELELEWDEGEYYYNGDPQGVTARLTNVVDGEQVNIEITYTDGSGNSSKTMPTDAGTYTATVTLDTPYGNYSFEAQSITFEIKMADVEVTLNYADDYKSNIFDGMAMPEEPNLTVVATSNDKPVAGTFKWTQTSFVWGTEEYSWTFVPDDPNYNVKQGTENFSVSEAKITKLEVKWVDDTHPAIFTSTTLDAIRGYLVVTGTLENNQTIDIAGYALTCDGFTGQAPTRHGEYTLKVKFNGKDATIKVNYAAVECNGIKIEAADGKEVKTDYYAFDTFDTSTIKVIATFTDGSERELSDTEYQIVYFDDRATMLYGDNYVKVNYNGKENPIYVNVEKKPYDISGWNFADKTSTYDGNGQNYKIEGVGDDFLVQYEYYKENADGTWTKLTSKDEVKNAGKYKIVATILAAGDISDNYTYPETLESKLTITKLTPDIGKPGVGGNLSVGTKLSELSLSVEIDGITGTFVWDNDEQILKEGINICRYTFIPDDANYNIVRGSIELPAGSAALPSGGDTVGGVGGSGVSEGMFAAIMVILVVSIVISLLALIVAFKKKGVASDSDGFYDDATPEQMKG